MVRYSTAGKIEEYDMLEYRIDKSTEIPHIKGIKIRADVIYLDNKNDGFSSEFIAKDRDLPLEAVKQAIKWCKENDDLITRVLKREKEEDGVE